MLNYHVISPAYGRDYKSEVQAKNDWFAGKDFVYENISNRSGHYCSIRDFKPKDVIELRFNRKAEFCLINCPQG